MLFNLNCFKYASPDPDITFRIEIKASVTVVFNALADRCGLSAWFTLGAEAIPEAGHVISFYEGGHISYMEMTEMICNEYVAWRYFAEGDDTLHGTDICFILSAENQKTILNFRHSGFDVATNEIDSYWDRRLIKLKNDCEAHAKSNNSPFLVKP
jgi:hypothetical protein